MRMSVPVSIPELSELESWLADKEARFPEMKPGVAAGIVWADPQAKKATPLSLVYLHGYTASRGEISPVADRIAQKLGANLFYARLTGHGIGPDGHRTVTTEDWMHDGLEALEIGRRLGTQVVVMGTSTGGTLACWMALGPAAGKMAATLLVSPNLTVKDRKSELLLWPGKEWVLRKTVGESVTIEPKNLLNAQYWDLIHHTQSLIPMMKLVNVTRKLRFQRWPSPVLVVYDLKDPVVDEKVTERLFSKVPEELVTRHRWTTKPGDDTHVLAGDALSPGGTEPLVQLSVAFLRNALGLAKPF